jgi:hypothetical protein
MPITAAGHDLVRRNHLHPAAVWFCLPSGDHVGWPCCNILSCRLFTTLDEDFCVAALTEASGRVPKNRACRDD